MPCRWVVGVVMVTDGAFALTAFEITTEPFEKLCQKLGQPFSQAGGSKLMAVPSSLQFPLFTL